MNFDTLLTQSAAANAAPAVGMLFVIRCVPDPFTSEQLNIGVCGIGADGRRVVRVITEPGRLKCLYGESAHAVVQMAAVAKAAAEQGAPPPSPQLQFDKPLPFYNGTLQQAVDDAFADQVTVALPHKAPEASVVTDEEAFKRLRDRLLEAMQTDAWALFPKDEMLLVRTPQESWRPVHIPIRAEYGLATVRSAYYSAQSLRTHLLESVMDLSFAARFLHKRRAEAMASNKPQGKDLAHADVALAPPAQAIFVLADPKATRKHKAAADRVMADVAERADPNLTMDVQYAVDDMAKRVQRWNEDARL